MTDPRNQPPRRVGPATRPACIVYGGSAAAFAAVLAALGWQVAAGADPAIGEAEPVAAAPAQRVVVRRVVRRVIVTRDAPAPARSTPAPAAAEQPPAAAPAPAPAPPTTRAS